MKIARTMVAGVFGISLLGLDALSQESGGSPNADPKDKSGQKVTVPAFPSKPEPGIRRPDRPNAELPESLRREIQEAEKAREAFITQQKDLVTKMRNSSKEDRLEMKEQLRENCERFAAAQKSRREEIAARIKELRETLANSRENMLSQVREDATKRRGR